MRYIIETLVGAFVLVLAGFLLLYAYRMQHLSEQGYTVRAHIEQIDGLREGANVCIGGVKIGEVEALMLDPASFRVSVALRIHDEKIKLPIDTKLRVESVSLLGGKYITLEPGMETDTIDPGGLIQFSVGSVSFEGLLMNAFMKKDAKTA